jgi:hypothetical protein
LTVAGSEAFQGSDSVIETLFFCLEFGDDFVDVHGRTPSYRKRVRKY